MIQAMVKKLNGKRLRQRISSAILIVAILVSFSGILGGTAMLVMGVQYHHALTNYGFSQGDIGKMMITFADTRSNLRAQSVIRIRHWYRKPTKRMKQRSRHVRIMQLQ